MRQAIHGAYPSRFIRILTSATAVALIAGCQPTSPGGATATRGASIGESVQLIERDVEAPEVFSANDRALWDGRPSLGGVWIAAPDVAGPERVIIRNEDNGKFVIGALFKRERANPGPTLQLSSDAAQALGILAGSPTVIDVVALRREEASAPTAAVAVPPPAAIAPDAPAPVDEEIVQTAAVDVTAPGPVSASQSVDAPRAPRGNIFSRLFWRPAPTPPVVLSDADLPLDPVGGVPAATAAVTATSLDAPPSPATASADASDARYVQIGLFSVEENARNTATSLSQAGIVPTVQEQESRGSTFWRVVVGPSTSEADRAAVIRKARAMGFEDAFAIRG